MNNDNIRIISEFFKKVLALNSENVYEFIDQLPDPPPDLTNQIIDFAHNRAHFNEILLPLAYYLESLEL